MTDVLASRAASHVGDIATMMLERVGCAVVNTLKKPAVMSKDHIMRKGDCEVAGDGKEEKEETDIPAHEIEVGGVL